jgi:hypothetical protein
MEIRMQRLKVPDACMALIENSFALDPGDAGQATGRLTAASGLARAVPAFQISYPRNYEVLPTVRDAILERCAELLNSRVTEGT